MDKKLKEWYREIGRKGGKAGVKNPKKGFGGMSEQQIKEAVAKRVRSDGSTNEKAS